MFRRLLLAPLLCLTACPSDTAPDARPKLPTVDAAAAATPDAPVVGADGPIAVDAPLADVDAPQPAPPDAPPSAPDAVPGGPATVILNELGPDFPASHDLIELLVTAGGTTKGIQVEKFYPHAPAVLATLPDVVVAKDELIVVHMSPAGTSAMAETTAVDEIKTADNFDGAWDFLGEEDDVPYTFVVLAVRDAKGKVTSAVPFFRSDISMLDQMPREFPSDVQAIIDEGLWLEACAPAPCSYSSNLGAVTVDWADIGTSRDPAVPAGASVARMPAGKDSHNRSDWQPVDTGPTGPYNSYGAPN